MFNSHHVLFDYVIVAIWVVVIFSCICIKLFWRRNVDPFKNNDEFTSKESAEPIKSPQISADLPEPQEPKVTEAQFIEAAEVLVESGEAFDIKEAEQVILEEVEDDNSKFADILANLQKTKSQIDGYDFSIYGKGGVRLDD